MTKDEILGVLAHPKEAKAFAEGKTIQFKRCNENWYDIGSHVVDLWVDASYRIKPEVHTATRWVNIYEDGPGMTLHKTKESAQEFYLPQNTRPIVRVLITWTEGVGLDD